MTALSRSGLDTAFASIQVAATSQNDAATRLRKELEKQFMYMTHEFTLSNL